MKDLQLILADIAQKNGVELLYACETGSRAWGFPSPDSDFDVRFIYMHKRDWYLSLSERKDTIEYMSGDLDITGWDLKKCLLLLKKSNAPLIERFQSPIEYFGENKFRKNFNALIEKYYSPMAVFYHHYSLAQKFWDELKDKEQVKLKNYFYLIRSLLSCHWIVKDKSVLPMDIEGLMQLIDSVKREALRNLIKLKSTVDEKYLYSVKQGMFEWIMELFKLMEMSKDSLQVNNADNSSLNEFFLKMVNRDAFN